MTPQNDDSDDSDTESFHSFTNDPSPTNTTTNDSTSDANNPSPTTSPPIPKDDRFPPQEEAALLAEYNSLKGSANQLFGSGSYDNAVQTYDRALSSCPNYLDYEIAVLRSNVAACHLKLREWKQASESATKGIGNLERLEGLPSVRKERKQDEDGKDGVEELGNGDVEELSPDMEARMKRLQASGHTLAEVKKLQLKLLMRRAKARTESGGWAELQGAEEDYRTVLHPSLQPCLSTMDKRQVDEAVRTLGPRLDEARDREMAEMMGKLKGLGNSILKPFGLSTNNFQFVKDENSGGYSMNFNQGGG